MKYYPFIILLIIIMIFGALWTVFTPENQNDIEVAYLPTDHSAALLVAKHNKTYENHGLNVKTVQINTGSDIVDAVASGDVDIGYVGITPTMQGISKGIPIKVVGSVNLIGSGIVVEPNSTITSPADLKGKKIATPGVSSIQNILLLYELRKYNITPEEVDTISINVYNIPSSLAAHKVDAYISYEPFVSLAPYENIGNVLIYSDEILKNHPCCVIIASKDFIKEHPQELKTFLKIHQQTTEYINTHPNETASIIDQELTTNLEVEKMSLNHIIFVSSVNKTFQEDVLNFAEIENSMGYLNTSLTAENIFDTEFLGD